MSAPWRSPPCAYALCAALAAAAARAAPCAVPVAAGTAAASCACGTQGQPATCTFPPGTNASVGRNAMNPCMDHYYLLGIATGVQKAAADPKVAMPFSAPTPTTYCRMYPRPNPANRPNPQTYPSS